VVWVCACVWQKCLCTIILYYAFITSPLTTKTTTTSWVVSLAKVCRQYKYRLIIVHGHILHDLCTTTWITQFLRSGSRIDDLATRVRVYKYWRLNGTLQLFQIMSKKKTFFFFDFSGSSRNSVFTYYIMST